MKITNHLNLPAPMVKAISRERKFRPNEISVTELITPPQLRALRIKHDAEIEEDASDRLWALLGTLMANALEQQAQDLDGHTAEEQLKIEVAGWVVTGRYDLSTLKIDGELLSDYKLTSVWALKDGIKREWEEQLNCYRYLIERVTTRFISAMEIVAVYRDWSKSKAKFEPDYPQQQVDRLPVPMWGPEETLAFIEERVRLHQEAQQGNYPECTPQERWERPAKWAVMKKNQKKAIKLYDNPAHAEIHAGNDPALFVVHRPGESVRCASYCPVSKFCRQYQESQPTLVKQLEASLEMIKDNAA